MSQNPGDLSAPGNPERTPREMSDQDLVVAYNTH